jgi:hypothetical protein
MKRLVAWTSVGSALLVVSTLATPAAGQPRPTPDRHPVGVAGAPGHATRASGPAARPQRLEVVGHSTAGGGGFNAGVFAHRHFAYLGVFGGDPAAGTPCPASGVKVVDYRDPGSPRLVAVLRHPRLTSAEDVVVRPVRTRAFTGDLAAVGVQACGDRRRVFRGLLLFDVTRPWRPRLLGRWAAPFPARGCGAVDLVQRQDGRVLAGCALPFAEQVRAGDEVSLVDATDPRSPGKVGGWSLGRDLGADPRRGVGCFAASLADGVRFANRGQRVYVSYRAGPTASTRCTRPRSCATRRRSRPGTPTGWCGGRWPTPAAPGWWASSCRRPGATRAASSRPCRWSGASTRSGAGSWSWPATSTAACGSCGRPGRAARRPAVPTRFRRLAPLVQRDRLLLPS